jgi:hypothetical protein
MLKMLKSENNGQLCVQLLLLRVAALQLCVSMHQHDFYQHRG